MYISFDILNIATPICEICVNVWCISIIAVSLDPSFSTYHYHLESTRDILKIFRYPTYFRIFLLTLKYYRCTTSQMKVGNPLGDKK